MTMPRILNLKKIGRHYFTTMAPVSMKALQTFLPKHAYREKNSITGPNKIDFNIPDLHAFTIIFSNSSGQDLRIGFDEEKNAFFIDRTKAGKSDFDPRFAAIHYAPRYCEIQRIQPDIDSRQRITGTICRWRFDLYDRNIFPGSALQRIANRTNNKLI